MSMTWFRSRRHDRHARRKIERLRRFSVESLEGRQMLSTFTVSNTADSGTGSLRAAIVASDANPGTNGPNTINFNIPGDYLQYVNLQSALPAITSPVTIDATTEPGYEGVPMITLEGGGAGASANGLTVEAANVTVKGLAINSFGGDGILVAGGNADVIADDYVGITAPGLVNTGGPLIGLGYAGNVPAGNQSGVVVESSAGVTIENSVISANTLYGVELNSTSGSVVEGDDIGTNNSASGDTDNIGDALGNGQIGVLINGGSTSNTVGGTAGGTADVISGNGVYGVYISDSPTRGNVVEGNFIGTDGTGTVAVGNDDGVDIAYGATDNTVGGTSAAARNIISGNRGDGIQLSTSGPGDVIEGNWIGISASVSGDTALGNGRSGVTIQYGATGDTIGTGNVISGNGANGIWFLDAGGDTVAGNFIGTDASGTRALPNGSSGVAIEGGSQSNTIGGTSALARNVIAGNSWDGVHIDGHNVNDNVVENDLIGVNVNGAPLANKASGVAIFGGAEFNTIGGTSAADRNIISGNGVYGVYLSDPGTEYNDVENDSIGPGIGGTTDVANGADGVIIQSGASLNSVSDDLISGNQTDGVLVTGSNTQYNLIADDTIGLNANGSALIDPNTYVSNIAGVELANGAYGTTVAFNTIAGNLYGVLVDSGATDNGIYDNMIGATASGSIVGNVGYGVLLEEVSGNTVAYNTIEGSDFGLVYSNSPSNPDYGNTYGDDMFGNTWGV